MKERELRGLIGKVKAGKLSRRGFVQAMMAVGIGAAKAAFAQYQQARLVCQLG